MITEAVILTSKRSTEFPKNHGGDFRNLINHPLNVQYSPDRQFKVALAELYYVPGSWPNVRSGSNYVNIDIRNYPINKYKEQTIYYDELSMCDDHTHQRFLPGIELNAGEGWSAAVPPGPGNKFIRLARLVSRNYYKVMIRLRGWCSRMK